MVEEGLLSTKWGLVTLAGSFKRSRRSLTRSRQWKARGRGQIMVEEGTTTKFGLVTVSFERSTVSRTSHNLSQ